MGCEVGMSNFEFGIFYGSEDHTLKIDAAELLKEQEPGKVLQAKDRSINETHGKTGFCPRCNQLVVWGVNRRYCGFCGKGLIWDD